MISVFLVGVGNRTSLAEIPRNLVVSMNCGYRFIVMILVPLINYRMGFKSSCYTNTY